MKLKEVLRTIIKEDIESKEFKNIHDLLMAAVEYIEDKEYSYDDDELDSIIGKLPYKKLKNGDERIIKVTLYKYNKKDSKKLYITVNTNDGTMTANFQIK